MQSTLQYFALKDPMVFGGLVTRIGRFNLPAENDIPSYFPGLITQEAASSVELILQPSSYVVT